MKNKTKLLVILLMVGLVCACKSEKKTVVATEIEATELIEVTNTDTGNFKIKLDYTSTEDGLLQVLYNYDEKSQWDKRYFKMNKDEKSQVVEANFNLGKLGSPNMVRFILGGETPKQIGLNKFTLSADGNIIEITANNFEEFVTCNKFVKINKSNNTLSTFKVNERHVPIMVLTKRALDSLTY